MVASNTSAELAAISDPDARLMLRVQAGDQNCFEQLVQRYQNRILTLLCNLVGQREEAEDLTQEVFLRIYRSRQRYRPTAKFSTWVFTIVNNLAASSLRRRRRRRTVRLELRDSGPLGPRPCEQLAADPRRDGPEQLAHHELQEVVRAAIEQLNAHQRLAVLLSKFEGMSYAEIGRVMGMSESAVKSLMWRARARLRELLEPYVDRE